MSELSLSDLELSVLVWPLLDRPESKKIVEPTNATECSGYTQRFCQQINVGLLRRAADCLRQDVDRQHQTVTFTRRQLPRGWYRKSNPTFDLEVFSNGLDYKEFIDLPKVCPDSSWQGNN